ncbi:hypothetical protein FKW77_001196 [Venturia effusa]|uniref:Uncharacterized protein n=1 Tax=Venturia effusa TaxID=50376 RepID=A0A517LPH1_9PEZI|nr:hypothetical protein FKW77_001196 [Venturia effusa]
MGLNTMKFVAPEDRALTPRNARLLLQHIFTPGFVPAQESYEAYARYLLAKPGGNGKAIYPLSTHELAKAANYVLVTVLLYQSVLTEDLGVYNLIYLHRRDHISLLDKMEGKPDNDVAFSSGVDRRGRKVCTGEKSESSPDAREEFDGESIWDRAERLGQRSMDMSDEASAPRIDEASTAAQAQAPRKKRSLSSLSGSSEEEPLMARKIAKQDQRDRLKEVL